MTATKKGHRRPVISVLMTIGLMTLLAACRSGADVPETWVFNSDGTIPQAARDDLNLQSGIADNRAVATVDVDADIAQLPDGTQLNGFTSVSIDVAGPDLDAPLRSAVLHWPAQSRAETAETAKHIAEQLGMATASIDVWALTPRDGGSLITDGQGINDDKGLSQIILKYRDVGADRPVTTVTLYWPN